MIVEYKSTLTSILAKADLLFITPRPKGRGNWCDLNAIKGINRDSMEEQQNFVITAEQKNLVEDELRKIKEICWIGKR